MKMRALMGVIAACLLATVAWFGTAASAGTSTFSNTTAITINDATADCSPPGWASQAPAAASWTEMTRRAAISWLEVRRGEGRDLALAWCQLLCRACHGQGRRPGSASARMEQRRSPLGR